MHMILYIAIIRENERVSVNQNQLISYIGGCIDLEELPTS